MNYIKKVSAKGCRILDACAGIGIYAFPLAECGYEDEHFDVVLNLGAYYYMCNVEEQIDAIKESLRVLKKDGSIFIYGSSVDEMSYENFQRFLNVHLKTCEVRSVLGYSEHGLYIGKKLV